MQGGRPRPPGGDVHRRLIRLYRPHRLAQECLESRRSGLPWIAQMESHGAGRQTCSLVW